MEAAIDGRTELQEIFAPVKSSEMQMFYMRDLADYWLPNDELLQRLAARIPPAGGMISSLEYGKLAYHVRRKENVLRDEAPRIEAIVSEFRTPDSFLENYHQVQLLSAKLGLWYLEKKSTLDQQRIMKHLKAALKSYEEKSKGFVLDLYRQS